MSYNQSESCATQFLNFLAALEGGVEFSSLVPEFSGIYCAYSFPGGSFTYEVCPGTRSVFPFNIEEWAGFGSMMVEVDSKFSADVDIIRADVFDFFDTRGLSMPRACLQLLSSGDYVRCGAAISRQPHCALAPATFLPPAPFPAADSGVLAPSGPGVPLAVPQPSAGLGCPVSGPSGDLPGAVSSVFTPLVDSPPVSVRAICAELGIPEFAYTRSPPPIGQYAGALGPHFNVLYCSEWRKLACTACAKVSQCVVRSVYGDPLGEKVVLQANSLVLTTVRGVYRPEVLWFPESGILHTGPRDVTYLVYCSGPNPVSYWSDRVGAWVPPESPLGNLCPGHALLYLGLDPGFVRYFRSAAALWDLIEPDFPDYVRISLTVRDPLRTRQYGVPDLGPATGTWAKELCLGMEHSLRARKLTLITSPPGQYGVKTSQTVAFCDVRPLREISSTGGCDLLTYLVQGPSVPQRRYISSFGPCLARNIGNYASFLANSPCGQDLLVLRCARPLGIVPKVEVPLAMRQFSDARGEIISRRVRLGAVMSQPSTLDLWQASQSVHTLVAMTLRGPLPPNERLSMRVGAMMPPPSVQRHFRAAVPMAPRAHRPPALAVVDQRRPGPSDLAAVAALLVMSTSPPPARACKRKPARSPSP